MPGQYEPPKGFAAGLNFTGAGQYHPPKGYKAGLEFAPSTEPPGDTSYLFPAGHDSQAFGVAAFAQNRFLGAGAIPPRNAWGQQAPAVVGYLSVIPFLYGYFISRVQA